MNEIALTDLIKSLGYKDHGLLANKIRDLLKEKEDFKKVIVEAKKGSGRADGRPEKFMVTKDATTLVDNLAILEPYVKLFGIADTESQYTPLKCLRDSKQRSNLKDNASKFEAKIRRDLVRSETALKQLPRLIECFTNTDVIDITKDSLRDLMKSTQNSGPADVSDTFEKTIWNEIIELKDEIEAGLDSSINNQRLGENLYRLGEFDDAIEHLERAVALNPENGTAHVILSLIYLKQLEEIDSGLDPVLRSNYFSGYFESPLNTEEDWRNECLEAGMEEFLTLRNKLIPYIIKGLYFWPEHSYKSQSESSPRKNYVYNLNFTFESQLDISRLDLIGYFLKYLSYSDFLRFPDLVTKIALGEFRSLYGDWLDRDATISNLQIAKAITITNWFSPDRARQLILNDTGNSTQIKILISQRFSLYRGHAFESLYIHLFGRTKYELFINEALIHLQKFQLAENLSMFARHRLDAIHGLLKKLDLHFSYESAAEPFLSSCYEQFELTDAEIAAIFDKIFQEIDEWQSLLQHHAWKNFSKWDFSFMHVEVLIVTACLLDFSRGVHSERNVAILEDLKQFNPHLSLGILSADYYVARELVLRAKLSHSGEQRENINSMIEAYSSAVEQRRQQEFDEAVYEF